MIWFLNVVVPIIAGWAFTLAYGLKYQVFRGIVRILKIEDSTEPLGIALANHYGSIKWQSLVLFILLITSSIEATFTFQLIPQPYRAIIHLGGATIALDVARTGRKVIKEYAKSQCAAPSLTPEKVP